VALTTIDKVVLELGLNHLGFIKMDIEGAEVAALWGAQITLSKYKPRLALAGYHNREDSEAIPAVVSRAWPGYRLEYGTFYHPGLVRPQALFFY
jgi:hypothetical protein